MPVVEQRLDDVEEYAQLLNFGAWGGMRAPADLPAPWNLDNNWQVVDIFSDTLPGERFVITDPVADTLQFDYAGMYAMAIIGAVNIVDVNRGRIVEIRLDNLTQGVQSNPVPVGVGRNTDILNLSFTFLFGIDAGGTFGIEGMTSTAGVPGVSADGDVFQLQMRCEGDTMDLVTWQALVWEAWRASPPVNNLIGQPIP